ncbi:hypothetical protein [Kitasatospora sp. P5_F3]
MDYESAHDLPSFVEMQRQLKGLKAWRLLIPKDERKRLKELELKIRSLGDTVDNFYRVLGPRNWIFHEALPVDHIAELLASTSDPSEVEAGLMAHYNNPDNLTFLLRRLRGHPALDKRNGLLIKAQEDYFCERYYACIHVLLSVMDGFVNEFETVRRGLHAREAEELKAWDSVVGHHMGLTNAHKTFTRAKSTPNEEPIYELYRNGIVHGSQLNYDNIVVATKAWNRLFAVVDWANATLKEKRPAPAQTSWRELIAQLVENDKRKRANEAFQPSQLLPGEDGFADHLVTVAVSQFLAAWERKNYGEMTRAISMEVQKAHGAVLPRLVNHEYSPYRLVTQKITAIDQFAPATCMVTVELGFADNTNVTGRMRWMYEDASGEPTSSTFPGEWRLYHWNPYTFLNSSR